ncbi:hypothetical protein D8Y22_05455 [Salinadaptatus halalkaliphilus]|uniref:Uncharacterized protein n=1 Tax=Salinadaptatus halalkaliphilus TaxID=2419781 RepID=A0A4S3TNJ0_9EURY|nr:hypothetical protein [Salinadaptatus halalkaliphilus]THE65831.1 hypothetical protein D8Y22_05455 [Salinadaptatus halalkaliphilus]
MTESTHPEEKAQSFEFTQTSPLSLSDFDGADHRRKHKLSFDTSTLPDDADPWMADLLDWLLDGINAITNYPTLCLWLRGSTRDLLLGYEPADGHERARFIRAATFSNSGLSAFELSRDNEIDAGLVTVFDAVNILYDFVCGVGGHYGEEPSVVLTDMMYLQQVASATHPIATDMPDGTESWSRSQLVDRRFPLPNDRDRVALPEPVFDPSWHQQDPPEDPHNHPEQLLSEHIDQS